MKIFFFCLISFFSLSISAQVGIGTNNPNNAAALDISSTNKGLLIPRVSLVSTTDNTTIPSPPTSLLIYNISNQNDVTAGYYYYDSLWKPLSATIAPSAGTSWNIGGNTISNANSYLGTANYNPLVFRVNNTLFGKFHPGGGITLGNNAVANDNNAIAIGTAANASASNQAIAIGANAIASGYQSMAIGYNAQSSNNSSVALGFGAIASGYQSSSLGVNAIVSAQNATAIGYNANAVQPNTVILGDASNPNVKIGIGTNLPDEKLHIVGSLKYADGSQHYGYVLTSDEVGKATWKNPEIGKKYGIILCTSAQTLNQYNNINFGTTGMVKDMTVSNDGITVTTSGNYKISYTVGILKSSGTSITPTFSLYKDYSEQIPGGNTIVSLSANEANTVSTSIIVYLNAYQKISIRSTISDLQSTIVTGTTLLSVESL